VTTGAGAGQAVALGLAAAAVWGAADFSGGLAARRAAPPYVIFVAHGLSLVVLLAVVIANQVPPPKQFIYALLSGVVGAAGLAALYGALARGLMGLTAALAGVVTAALPVVVSWVREGHAGGLKLAGFGVAAVAIWLVAYSPAETATQPQERSRAWIWLAVTAGLCFGGMLVLMQAAAVESVVWALTLSRTASTLVSAAACLAMGVSARTAGRNSAGNAGAWKSMLPLAALAGLFDTTGNWLYTLASLAGRLDVAAVVSSLYPAATILLAAMLLKERTRRSQLVGMGLAVAAVVLIAA
jgi:drug/metabolite transporter (DMT)-like permease